MPQSIATAVAPLPRHHDEPQQPQITLHLDDIRQVDGLYCLTDLWKLSGGKDKDKPSYFFRTDKAKELVSELEKERQALHKCEPYIIRVLGKGKEQGTYVCKELVYAYANWISAKFYLVVIRTFDRVVTIGYNPEYQTATEAVNEASRSINLADRCTTVAGRVLVTIGRYKKPILKKHLAELLSFQQLALPLAGGSNDN